MNVENLELSLCSKSRELLKSNAERLYPAYFFFNFPANTKHLYNICTAYKCYTNVFCLLDNGFNQFKLFNLKFPYNLVWIPLIMIGVRVHIGLLSLTSGVEIQPYSCDDVCG